eukprot:snap_masked-scaffold_25-processed-gene-4.33-mRNA-1 protein AED:1.00 eAED:1.00 QI:0/-1/0/0/-1/1/1/0/489
MISWPIDKKGKRSTTATNKSIWIAAIKDVDTKTSESIETCKNWRKSYDEILGEFGAVQFSSEENCVKVAAKGIEEIYKTFTVADEGKDDEILQDHLDEFVKNGKKLEEGKELDTVKVEGSTDAGNMMDKVKEDVTKEAIEKLLKEEGCEADVLTSFDYVHEIAVNKSEIIQNLQEKTLFVILGASSELCPLKNLLDWGFSVAGVSRPKVANQQKLKALGENSAGTLYLPKFAQNETTGADVMTDFLSIAAWISKLAKETKKRVLIGSYIYLDGAKNVQACLAMDVICKLVMEEFADAGIMYLTSPGTVLPIQSEIVAASQEKFQNRGYSDKALSALLGPFKPAPVLHVKSSKPTEIEYVYNGLSNVQGPSYALAKTLQNWRMIVAAQEGRIVSCPVMATCETESVFHVKQVATALRGMKYRFPPFTYLQPQFAKTLLAVMMMFDVLEDPNEKRSSRTLWWRNSVHGGFFRGPYATSSLGKAAFLYGMFQ